MSKQPVKKRPREKRDEQPRERQAVMQQAYREELVELIGRAVREDGVAEPLPGVHLARSSVPR